MAVLNQVPRYTNENANSCACEKSLLVRVCVSRRVVMPSRFLWESSTIVSEGTQSVSEMLIELGSDFSLPIMVGAQVPAQAGWDGRF